MIEKEKFDSGYDHKDTESRVYTAWEESGYFNPDVCIEKGVTTEDAPHFSMVLPPPNVTGRLHVGHALEQSLQDAIVRYNRMRGKRTLWIPGTDHAAIATAARVEKKLSKEGKSRHDFSREEFFDIAQEYALSNQNEILGQLRLLGGSLDWSRLAFTLDEDREVAVRTAFKRMYDDGLIYRGHRVVNWDPKGQTTVSDDEVEHEEVEGALYTFRYSKDFPISIATTRPETKVGDTAVAVHPNDERYKEYIGKTYTCDFAGVTLEIQVVADTEVDPDYGTGAVGVTPAHSMTDWDIAQRHELPLKIVINEYAKMTEEAGTELAGLKTKDAREKVVEWIKENGLLEKEEATIMNISKADRSGGVIEPLPKLQWFIDVNKEFTIKESHLKDVPSGSTTTLKELMRSVVQNSEISIDPERFERVYMHWVDNLRDWCVSRQILYGHRVPAWYHGDTIHVGVEDPEGEWKQDEDTLDTWFSSALWPFSTLGWPGESKDLSNYFPTSLINPAYEILFFWIARMILMSTYLTGEVPFSQALIHGLVRDKQGRKFSKSLDNGIEPEEVIEQFGTDALRMSLLVGAPVGNDINFNIDNVRGYRKFANKVWNIARFIFMNLPDGYEHTSQPHLSADDEKLLEEGKTFVKEVTDYMEAYQLHLASEKIYHYVWHRFADEIIEESKECLAKEGDEALSRRWVLVEIFSYALKMLHPHMPFVTEEIWQSMPSKKRDFLMVEEWPMFE